MPTSKSGKSKGWEPPSIEELHQLLPQYEIDAILGRGGMGAVYKGRQASLQRAVAIKLLPEDLIENDVNNYVERFKQEAQAMASLDHPAIISVHDFGQTSEGHLYFVMEFVDGMDIQQYIKASGGKVSPEYSISIVSHVLDALEYAHGQGIVHRDIKPANILINQEGRVKIADFGLAKQFGGDAGEILGLTMTNYAVGTPDFIAPEALEEDLETDGRADLYAVGVMLYQMLMGKLPRGLFKFPNEANPEIDARFDDIIAKAMNADRDYRYQSATEFRSKLGELLSAPVTKIEAKQETEEVSPAVSRLHIPESGVQAKPARSRVAHRTVPAKKKGNEVAIGIAVGCVVFAVIAFFLFRGGDDEKTPEVVSAEPVSKKVVVKQEPKKPPVETRKSPLVVSVTAKTSDWPTGPNYTREGRFRAWSSIPNDPAIDLAKLKGINDIAQVHVHGGGWVVLRKNGDTISSDGKADRQNIRRICPGWQHHFGLISRSRMLSAFNRDAEVNSAEIPTDLGKVKDAYYAPFHRVALLEDGTLRVWGMAYDGTKNSKNAEWKEKPFLPAGKKAVAISSSDHSLAVKLENGKLMVWHAGLGKIVLPDEFAQGKIGDFAITRVWIVGVPVSGGSGRSFLWPGNRSLDFPGGPVTGVAEAGLAAFAFLEKGGIAVSRNFMGTIPEVNELLKMVRNPKPEFISMKLTGVPITGEKDEEYTARLLWFDPDVKAPKTKSTDLTSATKEKPFENNLGMKFVPVPITGGPSDGKTVLFSIWETRVADYAAFIKANPGRDWPKLDFPQQDDHPAVNVSWDDAVAFCEWLTEEDRKNGKLEKDEHYRLPTDHEWSCAVGIGEEEDAEATPIAKHRAIPGVFFWGEEFPPPKGAGNYYGQETKKNPISGVPNLKPIEGYDDGYDRTASVGSFEVNEYGIYDMGGNVWEWCEDWYSTAQEKRLLRGSSWFTDGEIALLASSRNPRKPNARGNGFGDGYGFRCIIELGTDRPPPENMTKTGKPEKSTLPAPIERVSAPSPQSSPPIPNIPALKSNLANHQNSRNKQLGGFVVKYQAALKKAEDEAVNIGNLAHVEAIQQAMEQAKEIVAAINELPKQTGVEPLPSLPQLDANAPASLQRLRGIFDTETTKIETNLLTLFDKTLNTVQSDFVKANEIEKARQVEKFRNSLPLPKVKVEPIKSQKADEPASTNSPAIKSATKERPYVNSLGMKFVPVPGTGILICIHETRRQDYSAFADANSKVDAQWRNPVHGSQVLSTDGSHPVVNVNRADGLAFCRWLTSSSGNVYRLPTDREWSGAIGISGKESKTGTPYTLNHALKEVYPWGDDWPPRRDNIGNYSDVTYRELFPNANTVGGGYDDGYAMTSPVMSFRKNRLGIFDLDGNVWEWIQDFFDDPAGEKGLARGSNWAADHPDRMLSSHRQTGAVWTRCPFGGFRCVIELPEDSQ